MIQLKQLDRFLLRRRQIKHFTMMFLIVLMAFLAVIPLLLIFFHVLRMGLESINFSFFTELPAPTGEVGGGMGNAILGSLIMIAMATVVSVPLGVFGGIFLAEYAQSRLSFVFRLVVDLLNSLPSIVVGLFVYTVLVIPMKSFSAFAGALALTILMVPIVIKTTEEVLKLLPSHIREAGLALGISRWRVILFVALKSQMPSVLTGVMLAMARISGETAPLLVTAFGNRFWPNNLLQPTASLPVQIYNYAISPFEDWHKKAWAGALTLVMLIFILNVFSRAILYLQKKKRT